MRAVVLQVDERMLAERHRLGLDRHDEMWEGVLHVVPPASTRQQRLEAELVIALDPVARARGWSVMPETGVFADTDDYRVPDVVVFGPGAEGERGVDGAPEVVVEIRSPGDESDAKVQWYLGRSAACVVVVDRDTLALELHRPDGRVEPEADGGVLLEPLGIRIVPRGGTLVVGDHALRL